MRFGPSWLTHTGLPELVTATMSTLPWGSGLVGGDGPAGKEQDGGSPERAASSNSPRRPRSTAGRRRTPGSLLAFFTSRHGMAASAIAGVTSVAAVSVGILLLAGRVDTTAILRPVSPTSPPSTPDATVQSFDPPITLDGKGRGTAVDQLDGDLREYLAAEASSTYREWLGVHCGLDVHDSWITVDKWDPAGFAHGSYNGCSTASAVWWKDSNGWHAMPYRAPLPCDDLEAAQIPADVLPDDSAVCRERREVFTYTFATG
ncbi:hypothetical protein [Nocardioides alcanivorans]|uniref:hypothetical protein n=1 Tax=Nocardioides alcanivorans TaxID=2897352 RepID=UPI001F36AE92|nr:hypothetical protein [Nocardioides alcanivorans]